MLSLAVSSSALGFACCALVVAWLSSGSDLFCFNCGKWWGFGRVRRCNRCNAAQEVKE